MKRIYSNTCLGCDLLHNTTCKHYPKNNYPGHFKNKPTKNDVNQLIYSHQYVELRNGIYEGSLLNFKREGLGIFYSDEGFICIGNWFQDNLEGKAIIFFLNGGYLCANFSNNKMNGLGYLKFTNSSMIIGNWKNNDLHGNSFHYYPETLLWIYCEYKEGKLIKYLEEERNIGEYQMPNIISKNNELKNLLISVRNNTFTDEIIKENRVSVRNKTSDFRIISSLRINKDMGYIGFAEDDIPNGLGVVHVDQNLVFCGNFRKGIIDGLGRINFDNGDVYEGLFRLGVFHGIGVYYDFENNKFTLGNFEKNNCIKIFQIGSDFPVEVTKQFKKIIHKKHIKFTDKTINITTKLNQFIKENNNNLKNNENELNDSPANKTQTINLKPASKLEKERNKIIETEHNDNNQKEFYMIDSTENYNSNYSNFYLTKIPPQLYDHKYINKLSIDEVKCIQTERKKQNFRKKSNHGNDIQNNEQEYDASPIVMKKTKKEKYIYLNHYDFYEKNIENFTVTSRKNDINEKLLKTSTKDYFNNKEIVYIKKKKNNEGLIDSNILNKSLQKETNLNFYSIEKPKTKRISLLKTIADYLIRDKSIDDDLRHIYGSEYKISLESDYEFQTIKMNKNFNVQNYNSNNFINHSHLEINRIKYIWDSERRNMINNKEAFENESPKKNRDSVGEENHKKKKIFDPF